MIEIVTGATMNERCASKLDDTVEVRRSSYVSVTAEISNSMVVLLIAAADLRGSVGGSVVRNDDLEIR